VHSNSKYNATLGEQQMKYAYANKPLRAGVDGDDEEEIDQRLVATLKKKAFQQYEQQFTAQQIHFYISKVISEPEDYTDMIHRMNMATPVDIIFIHLNTPGGSLDAGVQIITAMQNSAAKVVTILEGMAHSLGTLIFLAGDEMIVNDHCLMLFHNFKGGIDGKGHELVVQLAATVKWFAMFAKKFYIPFLTEDEFTRLVNGEDFWMHSAEIRRRLNRMMKIINNEKVKVSKPPKVSKTKSKKIKTKATDTNTDS
jgi:ATP-dependent protease ClpP protease subunit